MTEIAVKSWTNWGPIKWLKHLVTRQASSFTYLNVTQFLGALNDNVYKFLLIYFLIQLEGIEHSPRILALSGAVFVIPFLLFSSASGTLADKISKRDIIVFTKILELVIMAAGVMVFLFESSVWSFAILFLMATQSAIFGPSKYGIIPEIVSSERLSKANGVLTMFTFVAIIVGTFLPAFLLDHTDKNFILASLFCTGVALVGLITSYCIEETPAAKSTKKIRPSVLTDVYQALKLTREHPSLLTAVWGSAYFLFCAAFFQMNMIPFAVQVLGLTDIQGGYLFCLTSLGIGAGAVLAGKISGKQVELALVPIGGFGIVMGCFLVDMLSSHLAYIVPLVISLGVFGGTWLIPLDTYIQMTAPKEHRGQIVATANFLSFAGVLLACLFLYIVNDVLGWTPDKAFTIIGAITVVVSGIISYQFFDYITRFVGMLFSRMRFHLTFAGREHIPETPAIFVCTHTAWNDTLALMGSQRHRMRFFIEQEQDHNLLMRRLYRLLRVVPTPPIETVEHNQKCLDRLHKALEKGISVCLFVESPDVTEEIQRLRQTLHHIAGEQKFPVVPVFIDKGEKLRQARWFSSIRSILRCPTLVTFGAPLSLN